MEEQMENCKFKECTKEARTLGYCTGHYKQYNAGKELTPLANKFIGTMEERILWYSIKQDNGCWDWTGYTNENGYPITAEGDLGIGRLAHRIAYVIFKKDTITDIDVIHHTCGNNSCVNPDHLQKINQVNNVAEMRERKHYQKEIEKLKKTVEKQQKTIQKCCKNGGISDAEEDKGTNKKGSRAAKKQCCSSCSQQKEVPTQTETQEEV
jgi:hypothetical protein